MDRAEKIEDIKSKESNEDMAVGTGKAEEAESKESGETVAAGIEKAEENRNREEENEHEGDL